MDTANPYPFYRSLRFRFGLIFGMVFFCCLMVIVFFLYARLKHSINRSFNNQLTSQAKAVLQKTEVSPLIVPLPEENEQYLITYNNLRRTDTLFNNIAFSIHSSTEWPVDINRLRVIWLSKTLETGGVITIFYAYPTIGIASDLQQFSLLLFIYIPVALIVSVIAGYFISGFLLHPVNRIIQRADNIDLYKPVALLEQPGNKDELHHLTMVLNRMLERIKKQSDQQTAFFAAASHELRTPLSVMQTELEVMAGINLTEGTLLLIKNQLSETRRLIKIVNNFLLMSQLKTGILQVQKNRCNLVETVLDCCERFAEFRRRPFLIQMRPPESDFSVFADATYLSVVVTNLLENAIKYKRTGTDVMIEIFRHGNSAGFSVSNYTDIKNINTSDLKRQFFRAETSHNGIGLGLWIADQLISEHNGILHLSCHNDLFAVQCELPSIDRL